MGANLARARPQRRNSRRVRIGKRIATCVFMNKDESFAHEVGLRYVHDREPGLSRKRRGKGFSYVDHRNRVVRSNILLARLTALVIPPAWENVWICRHENGHIQVTGRDVRLRKQYRYHTRWSELRNQNKFHNLERFGKLLPKIPCAAEAGSCKTVFFAGMRSRGSGFGDGKNPHSRRQRHLHSSK